MIGFRSPPPTTAWGYGRARYGGGAAAVWPAGVWRSQASDRGALRPARPAIGERALIARSADGWCRRKPDIQVAGGRRGVTPSNRRRATARFRPTRAFVGGPRDRREGEPVVIAAAIQTFHKHPRLNLASHRSKKKRPADEASS